MKKFSIAFLLLTISACGGTSDNSTSAAIEKLEAQVEALSQQLEEGSTSTCLLYTSPSPRDLSTSRMPSSA